MIAKQAIVRDRYGATIEYGSAFYSRMVSGEGAGRSCIEASSMELLLRDILGSESDIISKTASNLYRCDRSQFDQTITFS